MLREMRLTSFAAIRLPPTCVASIQSWLLSVGRNIVEEPHPEYTDFMQPPIQLSSDELAMLGRGEALRLHANGTQEVVLVLAEQYERLKQCIDFAEADPKSLYPLIAEVSPDDWEALSAYPNAEKL